MSGSGGLSVRSAQGHARGTGQDGLAPGADLSSTFEEFLTRMSAAVSVAAPDDVAGEIIGWVDEFGQMLGADQCVVGELYDAEREPRFLFRWDVGNSSEYVGLRSNPWLQGRLASGQVTAVSTLEDLPPKAQEAMEQRGVRSGIWVPMMADQIAVGGVGFQMTSSERAWPDKTIQRCQLVADVIGNAFVRRRRSSEIAERTHFESLVTDFSFRLMNIQAEPNEIVDGVLRDLGLFLGIDRVGYLEVDSKERSLVPTRQWFNEGIAQDRSKQYVDVSGQFPWLVEKIVGGEPVAIDDLDEFPTEASKERQYCEGLEIMSFTMVPAMIGGSTIAALALDNMNSPRTWTNEILQRLQFVAEMIASAIDRGKREIEVARLRQFENTAAAISTAFVNLPHDKVDERIKAALKQVARSLDADLMTLQQPLGSTGYSVTHQWSSLDPVEAAFENVNVEEVFPWLAVRLRENEPLVISKLSDFPADAANERAAMGMLGLNSVLWVPFDIGGELAGHLAVNTVEQTTWSNELIPRLKLLGEVFGEALRRRDVEVALHESFEEIKTLKEQLSEENMYLRREIELTQNYNEIVGDSAALHSALAKVEQVAQTDSTVLITGETGTGKELLARAIHNNSARADRLMVKVNCAALPSSLVEAELFGREKGAYTGAMSREPGRFEIADGSTILLDEIGETSLELQAKLLRVLQDGQFERLGSSRTLDVNVRVLAATNKDLRKAVDDKTFREDLFYRINVFPIEVPPLRDRIEDVPQLVWQFVQEFSQIMGKSVETIPRKVMESLQAYSWPGNVREVRNVIERAMILTKGPTLEVELPNAAEMQTGPTRVSKQLSDVERDHIRSVVESSGWRIRGDGGAAEILGLKPTTLEARMKKLGITRTDAK